jgi:DNA-directed RNA polymerase specialized sigma24 family protein
MVRKRVPERDVEDIVQTALAEAVESPHAPTEREALRRWIFGVAKNKVVDYHRRAGRETFDVPDDVSDDPAPHVEADLLRWAQRHLPEGDDAHRTLDWMLREGEGEKLESIALSEKVPAPRIRQRVSRLRRHFKTHWAREVALLAALGIVVSAVVFFVLRRPDEVAPNIDPDPTTVPPELHEQAERMRRMAFDACDRAVSESAPQASTTWQMCLEGLDRAKAIDPRGDGAPNVQEARRAAAKALSAPIQLPPPVPSAQPTSSMTPPVPPVPSSTSSAVYEPPSPVQTALSKTIDEEAKRSVAKPGPDAKPSSTATPPVPTPAPPSTELPTKTKHVPKPPSKAQGNSIDFGASGTGMKSAPPSKKSDLGGSL